MTRLLSHRLQSKTAVLPHARSCTIPNVDGGGDAFGGTSVNGVLFFVDLERFGLFFEDF